MRTFEWSLSWRKNMELVTTRPSAMSTSTIMAIYVKCRGHCVSRTLTFDYEVIVWRVNFLHYNSIAQYHWSCLNSWYTLVINELKLSCAYTCVVYMHFNCKFQYRFQTCSSSLVMTSLDNTLVVQLCSFDTYGERCVSYNVLLGAIWLKCHWSMLQWQTVEHCVRLHWKTLHTLS